jgi:hypothetical protein
MMRPTIHSNGTPQSALLDAHCTAMNAIRDAIEALAEIAPNGRDFYPQGEGALGIATREHIDRCQALRSVLGELEEIAEYICDAAEVTA